MFYELISSMLAMLTQFYKNAVSFAKFLLFYRVPHWRLPPGPLANWLPVFGSLPLFAITPSHLMLTKISEKYERIFYLRFGKTTFIVICDPDLLRDTFAKDAVSGRNMPPMMDVMDHQGLVHADGEFWATQRSFVLKTLQDLGLPRTNELRVFDQKATEAICSLLDELKNKNGFPITVDEALCITVLNIFFSMIIGKTFERQDPRLLAMIDSSHDTFRSTEPISFANFCPFIARLPVFAKSLEDIQANKKRFNEYMQSIIQDHRQKLDQANPKDLIDAFLVQMTSGKHSFTESQLYALLGDLFTASLESTVATIHWLLLALVKFPSIQQKIVDQLREVTKNERAPTLDDRNHLPYLEAVILETYRFSSVLPYGVPHGTTEATTIDGYHIPKNSTVVGLFWKFNRDKNQWHNPSDFDPNNHFENGVLVRNRNLMPFSTGKRMCISEAVANDEVFLLIANLLYKFIILPGDGDYPTPGMSESLEGLLRVPRHFKVRFVLREPGHASSSEC